MKDEDTVDAVERESTAAKRPDQSIVACPDGPLLVRGDFEIVTPSGEPLPRNRKTVALCRCGASIIKPYCDGTHKLIGFRTDD
ncbi:CDGSH iron-sulfur domain-containing protein [Arthrobacter monumenti]